MDVHILARQHTLPATPSLHLHTGDLSDPAILGTLLPLCGTVVHLASSTTPGSSANKPSDELDNLRPTLNLLDRLINQKGIHLIFVSSGGTVYGNPPHIPVNEDAPFAPRSYHGAGKMALEGFLQAFRTAGNAVTILRPSNAYGHGQGLRRGFGFVRSVLEHARNGSPLEIWGDGEAVRDFVYVEDVAEAVTLAIGNPADNGTYNVGSGQGHTLNEVLALAQRITGAAINTLHKPARDGDVRGVVLDVSRIRSALGWQPRINLDEGLRLTWEWLQRT
jgi:UDP-glucose 4-epimerase